MKKMMVWSVLLIVLVGCVPINSKGTNQSRTNMDLLIWGVNLKLLPMEENDSYNPKQSKSKRILQRVTLFMKEKNLKRANNAFTN